MKPLVNEARLFFKENRYPAVGMLSRIYPKGTTDEFKILTQSFLGMSLVDRESVRGAVALFTNQQGTEYTKESEIDMAKKKQSKQNKNKQKNRNKRQNENKELDVMGLFEALTLNTPLFVQEDVDYRFTIHEDKFNSGLELYEILAKLADNFHEGLELITPSFRIEAVKMKATSNKNVAHAMALLHVYSKYKIEGEDDFVTILQEMNRCVKYKDDEKVHDEEVCNNKKVQDKEGMLLSIVAVKFIMEDSNVARLKNSQIKLDLEEPKNKDDKQDTKDGDTQDGSEQDGSELDSSELEEQDGDIQEEQDGQEKENIGIMETKNKKEVSEYIDELVGELVDEYIVNNADSIKDIVNIETVSNENSEQIEVKESESDKKIDIPEIKSDTPDIVVAVQVEDTNSNQDENIPDEAENIALQIDIADILKQKIKISTCEVINVSVKGIDSVKELDKQLPILVQDNLHLYSDVVFDKDVELKLHLLNADTVMELNARTAKNSKENKLKYTEGNIFRSDKNYCFDIKSISDILYDGKEITPTDKLALEKRQYSKTVDNGQIPLKIQSQECDKNFSYTYPGVVKLYTYNNIPINAYRRLEILNRVVKNNYADKCMALKEQEINLLSALSLLKYNYIVGFEILTPLVSVVRIFKENRKCVGKDYYSVEVINLDNGIEYYIGKENYILEDGRIYREELQGITLNDNSNEINYKHRFKNGIYLKQKVYKEKSSIISSGELTYGINKGYTYILYKGIGEMLPYMEFKNIYNGRNYTTQYSPKELSDAFIMVEISLMNAGSKTNYSLKELLMLFNMMEERLQSC